MLINRRTVIATGALFLAARGAFASDGSHVVEMLNVDPENRRLRNIFLPRIVTVQPGETILFQSTNPGHNTQAIEEMIPGGTEAWNSKIGQDFELTLDQPGFYGYKCTPHVAIGMVGLIIVQGDGMMDNMEAARAVNHRGRAKMAFEEIWAEVDEQGLAS
ncbi:MAG: plastocyanin/azurin family copper-binding protein [Pseudomonadota bacterium]